MSDEPQLLAVNLVRSNGSPALTGHYFVDILPQPDIRSGQKHFFFFWTTGAFINRCRRLRAGRPRWGRRRPTFAHPLGALQHPTQATGAHPGQTSNSQVSSVASSTDAEAIAPAVPPPSPTLMERLNPAQRSAFLRVWARLPPHRWGIAFDLHDPGWDPPAIEQLGDVLCDLPDVFSTSKTDAGSCSVMPFEISVPEDSDPVTSRPHRINPILAREVDATLDQYLAAGLSQHSISPYSGPLVVIPKRSGGVRITVNYKKLNQISKLNQLPIARVDQVLDSLGSGRVFSLFDLVFSFHHITVHKDTVPLTAFCTPTVLYAWLVMPQGSSASPGWLVKVINEVIKGSNQVAAYLDDVIVYDSDPSSARSDDSLPLRTPSKAQSQAFPLEGAIGRHRCQLSRPLHFSSRPAPKCGKGVGPDQNANAHRRNKRCAHSWVVSTITANFCPTYQRDFVRLTRSFGRG